MAYKTTDITYEDFAIASSLRKSPLEKALDTLAVMSLTIMENKHEQELLDKKLNYNARSNEIGRLATLDPLTVPSDFGDPYSDADDYLNYKTTVLNNLNMNKLGREYITDGVVLSDEAMSDVFSYGDENVTVEMTPTGMGMNDVLNFDAWLLGSLGKGREIAARENWTGLLDAGNFDAELGGYVLDESDYRDLTEKGLVENADNVNGLYILNEQKRNQVIRNYKNWREGFVGANTLPTDTQVTKQIHAENTRILVEQDKLRHIDSLSPHFSAMDSWNRFTIDPEDGIIILNEDENAVDQVQLKPGQWVSNDDFLTKPSLNKIKTFVQIRDIDQALSFWQNDASLREEFKTKAPVMYSKIIDQFGLYLDLKGEFAKQGINQSQADVVNDSKVMVDGRNVVLSDLRSGKFSNGLLFDEAQWDALSDPERNEMIKSLVALESSYTNISNINYNDNIIEFLKLYGLELDYDGNITSDPGVAIINLLEELGGR